MKKILFVCYGNIMRSQIAEAYYNFFTKTKNASSAGVDVTTPSRYTHPADEVILVMNEEGMDLSQQDVKLVTKEMVDEADKVYILTKKDYCPAFLVDSPKVAYWDIADPYGTSLDNFRKIRDEIKLKVQEILE